MFRAPALLFLLACLCGVILPSLAFGEMATTRDLRYYERVQLVCEYSLDLDDSLQSVQWFKDYQEFHRFVPGETPPMKMFPEAGIKVDHSSCSNQESMVQFEENDDHMTSLFMCEVTTHDSKISVVPSTRVIDTPKNDILNFDLRYPFDNETRRSERIKLNRGEKHLVFLFTRGTSLALMMCNDSAITDMLRSVLAVYSVDIDKICRVTYNTMYGYMAMHQENSLDSLLRPVDADDLAQNLHSNIYRISPKVTRFIDILTDVLCMSHLLSRFFYHWRRIQRCMQMRRNNR